MERLRKKSLREKPKTFSSQSKPRFGPKPHKPYFFGYKSPFLGSAALRENPEKLAQIFTPEQSSQGENTPTEGAPTNGVPTSDDPISGVPTSGNPSDGSCNISLCQSFAEIGPKS